MPAMIDRPVTAEEMEAARADRAAYEKQILEETGALSLVSFTAVAPGPNKRNPIAKSVFVSGRRAIVDSLLSVGIAPLKIDIRERVTGNELYVAMFLPPLECKRRMCELEDVLPFGRLLNIDVLDADARHVARTELGYPERCCLVCGKSGHECARTHAHSQAELDAIIETIAEEGSLQD